MTLKVIGAGFGRTGTVSMHQALERLGFGPCHHMMSLGIDDVQKRLWRELVAGGKPDWNALLGGFGACVDWPTAHYWRELMAAFPDAKVVLTWRSAESWWDSFSQTIMFAATLGSPESVGVALIGNQVFGGKANDREHAVSVYNAHVQAVLAEVPAGRLILHRLGDGWGPLCAGLGVPVPDQPYPSTNTTKDFQARDKR